MAVWPLIALALQRGDLAQAAKKTRTLLAENQHPLAEEVMTACRTATDASTSGDDELLRVRLQEAVQRARDFHYL